MSEYAERDPEQLDKDGDYYFKHVSAMTAESLHSKAAIAAELAYRDRRIDELQKQADCPYTHVHMSLCTKCGWYPQERKG